MRSPLEVGRWAHLAECSKHSRYSSGHILLKVFMTLGKHLMLKCPSRYAYITWASRSHHFCSKAKIATYACLKYLVSLSLT